MERWFSNYPKQTANGQISDIPKTAFCKCCQLILSCPNAEDLYVFWDRPVLTALGLRFHAGLTADVPVTSRIDTGSLNTAEKISHGPERRTENQGGQYLRLSERGNTHV